MTGAIVLSTCPGCNQTKIRSDYNTKRDGTRYERCISCGNPPAPRPLATRECLICKQVKPIRTGFCEPRTKHRAYSEYSLECRDCRKELGLTKEKMAATAKSRAAAKRDEKRNAPKPVERPVFDWKWNGKVYGEQRV